MPFAYSLGQTVVDKVTGFRGILIARIEYINGCIQYAVKPRADKDGKMVESEYIDEQLLETVDGGVCVPAGRSPVGGDQPDKPQGY